MTRKIRKFNPGFLTDRELVDCFCIRKVEFALLVECLRESTGTSNPHTLVIGPRGSGKTMLLLRVAAEVRKDSALSSAWFPVVFPEETYEVSSCGEFWLQCLFNLANQAPREDDGPDLHGVYEELLAVQDDRTLADLALAVILDFADSQGRRLVLFVENLNTLFDDIGDPEVGWQLRKTLQCEPRIFLLGSATSRFKEINSYERALYDQFQVHPLKPLNTESCAILWKSISERDIDRRAIRSLEILTGGNPRLLSIVAEFGSRLSFRELMDDLLDLIDDHTEYFRSHLEALGPQDRRVYLALATLWKPATAKQVSVIARLSPSHCSALLKRLITRGAVIRSSGTPHRWEYYLAERMYNIYYLLRRGQGTNHVVEALIHFMTVYYSHPELVGIRERSTVEAESAEGPMRAMLEKAIPLLASVTKLEFGTTVSHAWRGKEGTHPTERTARLATKARQLLSDEAYDRVIAVCDEIEVLTSNWGTAGGAVHLARALCAKCVALARTGRTEEAVGVCDETLTRYSTADSIEIEETISTALENKVALLGKLQRPQEVLANSEAFARRFDSSDSAVNEEKRSRVLFHRGTALAELDQPRRALAVFDEVIQRFGSNDSDEVQEPVARALLAKVELLAANRRVDETLAQYDAVIDRYSASQSHRVASVVATALVRKGGLYAAQSRFRDALACFEAVSERFEPHTSPELAELLATAQVNKGATLDFIERHREAQRAYDDLIQELASSDSPEMADLLATAFANRSVSLMRQSRLDEAFASVDAFLKRFKGRESPTVLRLIGSTLLEKAKAEFRSGQPDAAIETAGRVLVELPSNPVENLILAHLLRAEGYFTRQNRTGCESELSAMLKLLPELTRLPKMSIKCLMAFAIRFGPRPVLDLIEGSPSLECLHPLVTALRQELGIETKVAKEVEHVANDIRLDFARLRQMGPP